MFLLKDTTAGHEATGVTGQPWFRAMPPNIPYPRALLTEECWTSITEAECCIAQVRSATELTTETIIVGADGRPSPCRHGGRWLAMYLGLSYVTVRIRAHSQLQVGEKVAGVACNAHGLRA